MLNVKVKLAILRRSESQRVAAFSTDRKCAQSPRPEGFDATTVQLLACVEPAYTYLLVPAPQAAINAWRNT